MTKNKRLISLLIAGTIATSGVTGLTGCGNYSTTFQQKNEARKNLAIEMSLDAGQQIFNIVSFDMYVIDWKCYIKFLAHYDAGTVVENPTKTSKYIDHKDYLITYEISGEEYRKLASFYNNSPSLIQYLNLDDINTLQYIVDAYDPISVEESTIDVEYRQHSK